jgi:hypothetical protein
MKKLFATATTVVAVLGAACGGSPTAPQSSEMRTNPPVADVGSAPTPAPPANPVPTPAPSPAPAPAPVPTPDSTETWTATVDVQRATPGSALPPTFTVTIRGDQMRFGPLEVTILARQGNHMYARKGQEITIEIDDGKWTVTSVDVFATGTLSSSGG